MRGLVWFGVVAAAVAVVTPVRPAQAYWRGGGYGWGGFAAGAAVGATVGILAARPYYGPYGYAPPYGYYPAPVYAAPYPYPPPGYVYAPPAPYGYAPQGTVAVPPAYANAQPVAPAPVRSCGAGMFFNTLTGNCDRR